VRRERLGPPAACVNQVATRQPSAHGPRRLAGPRIPSLEIFRHRAFAQYWVARWFGTFAVQMQLTAMGWQIYDAARAQGQSIAEAAFLLGLVGLAQFLPLLVLSLFGGQAADRYNRRLILVACFAAKAAIALALALVSQFGPGAIIPAIFAAAIGAGATNAFMPPAATALLPMLLPRDELPQGIAWSSLAFQSSLIIGPAVGGLIYAFGPVVPYSATFALLLLAGVLMLTLRAPKQGAVAGARTIGMIKEGLRFVWANKIVLGAISLDLVVVLLAGAVALLPVFARDILHAGPSELGVLRSAMGVGAAAVALGLVVKPLRTRVGFWMFGATIVFGLATIAFGLSQYLWLTAFALAVAGGVDMISVYVRQTLIQLNTPDAMRGRVAAVSFVFISASNELGDFEAGLMARIFGPVLAVTIGGAAAILASLGWMRLFPDLAKADGFEPTAETRETPKQASARP
jgi:MFS family permease